MTRPRKRTLHCRSISSLRFQDRDKDSDSDSDDVIEIVDDGLPEETSLRSADEALKWVEEAYCRSRMPYHRSSRRTTFRQQAERKRRLESAKTNMKITSFFGVQTEPPEEHSEDLSPTTQLANIGSMKLTIPEAIEKLRSATQNTPSVTQQRRLQKSTNEWQFMCLLAIRQYFQQLQKESGKIRISEEISKFLFPDRNHVHQGRLIRQWADHYLHSGLVPESRQGRFVKIRSLVGDNDVQRILRTYIRGESANMLTSCSLASWVKDNLHLKLKLASPVIISEKTAQRWLKYLGLTYGRYTPGLYTDGHERSDVVKYREHFLERFELYEKRMFQYEGEFMEKLIPPSLNVGERPLILVTHDESCFSSHDGRDFVWLDEDNHPIRPKGDGRSLMVSAFLCECHGLLRLSDEQKLLHPGIPADATVIIKPGVNAEGYWKNSDLVAQLVEKAFPIFRVLHPDCDGLFMFDNSQNHHAKPPDALNVNVLNLKDGGKNSRPMRNGWFTDMNGQRVSQTLYTAGLLKGVRTILIERNLWPEQGLTRDAARDLLKSQPDFQSQKEWLEDTVTDAGFAIDFYPKYHCDFNFIEMFWGAAKAYARKNCNYDFHHLIEIVPLALESVSLSKIRKYARKSYRYIDLYRVRGTVGNSLTPKQIEYAVKEYRQHRKIPLRILKTLE
jgi:hypothetical protein